MLSIINCEMKVPPKCRPEVDIGAWSHKLLYLLHEGLVHHGSFVVQLPSTNRILEVDQTRAPIGAWKCNFPPFYFLWGILLLIWSCLHLVFGNLPDTRACIQWGILWRINTWACQEWGFLWPTWAWLRWGIWWPNWACLWWWCIWWPIWECIQWGIWWPTWECVE